MKKYQEIANQFIRNCGDKLKNYSFPDNACSSNKNTGLINNIKNKKKEKILINDNIKIITDFVNSILITDTDDTVVNSIDFEMIDDHNMRLSKKFFYELDEYFNSINATYSYTVNGDTLSFSVIINDSNR